MKPIPLLTRLLVALMACLNATSSRADRANGRVSEPLAKLLYQESGTGVFYADASDASIRAAAARAYASGGGTVKIGPGTAVMTAPLVLQNGVIYEGSGVSWISLGNQITSGVGTVLTGDGTFNCFEYNPTNNTDLVPSTGNPNPVTQCVKGAGVKALGVSGFLNGLKFGALNKSGLTPMLVKDVVVQNCVDWGFWFENCQSGDIVNVTSLQNGKGGLALGGSSPQTGGQGGWNFGNLRLTGVYVQRPTSTAGYKARGVSIFARNGASFNAVTASEIEVLGSQAAPEVSGTATVTAGSQDIAVPDLSKFTTRSPVIFTTTTGNITANVVWFVVATSAETGAGTIKISNYLNGAGSEILTPSASGTPTFYTGGPALLEIGGWEAGSNVTGLTMTGTDMEVSTTVNTVIQKCAYVKIIPGLCAPARVFGVVRNVLHDSWYHNVTANTAWDLDASSQRFLITGLNPTSFVSNTGVGFRYDTATAQGKMYMQNGVYMYGGADFYSGFAQANRVLTGNITTGQTANNPTRGNGIFYGTNAAGSINLATATATTVGTNFDLSNPTAFDLTVNTDGTQTINNQAGVTSVILKPGEMARVISMPHPFTGGVFFWAVSISNPNHGRLRTYTVSTLPAGVAGDQAYVTDASSPTYLGALTGGGSSKVPVFYDGSQWVAH